MPRIAFIPELYQDFTDVFKLPAQSPSSAKCGYISTVLWMTVRNGICHASKELFVRGQKSFFVSTFRWLLKITYIIVTVALIMDRAPVFHWCCQLEAEHAFTSPRSQTGCIFCLCYKYMGVALHSPFVLWWKQICSLHNRLVTRCTRERCNLWNIPINIGGSISTA